MIRFRVEPKPLPNVRDVHTVGVFGRFEDVVDDRIARLEASEEPADKEKVRFFRYLRNLVDHKKFGEMQEFQLSDAKLNPKSDFPKYIDPTIWFESKLAMAQRIGLHERAPLDILDIGTGPGHFPVVAKFYGHRVVGTDVPKLATGNLELGHLYDALNDLYELERLPLRIEEFKPLPPFPRRYGLVTAFLAAFNVDAEKKPWTIEAWRFFLNDLRENVLTEDGELFMALANGKLTPEVWDYLSARAVFKVDASKQIHFTDLKQFA